jgi:GNAT superfamily N-acetyltransferase
MGRITPISELPKDLETLRSEASNEGFHFMERFIENWMNSTNRFKKSGEVLLASFDDNLNLIAIAGLNIDPYSDDGSTARIRHLFVLKRARRMGVASDLVKQLLNHAKGRFDVIRLRTDTHSGALFYEAIGFHRSPSATSTHEIRLLD